MAIFRGRLAPRQDLYYAFVACSFPVFLWTFYKIFNQTPALIIKMSLMDVFGVIAYALAISLIESIIIWIFFVILGVILPEKLFRKKFVSQIMSIMLVSGIWAVNAQFHYQDVYNWTFLELLPWLGAYFASILLVYLVIQRFDRLSGLLFRVTRAISVLSTLYVFFGVVGFVIVILRNL